MTLALATVWERVTFGAFAQTRRAKPEVRQPQTATADRREEAPKPARGFFATLTDEQKRLVLNVEDEEGFGDPSFPKLAR